MDLYYRLGLALLPLAGTDKLFEVGIEESELKLTIESLPLSANVDSISDFEGSLLPKDSRVQISL